MPVSAFFPSASSHSTAAPVTPVREHETSRSVSAHEGNHTTPDSLQQRLRSISAAQSLATRGWRFPSSRRYLWDRTAVGACLSIEVKDLVPPVEIPHSFFAGQTWLARRAADSRSCNQVVAKYSTRSATGVKITLEQEDLLNAVAQKTSGHNPESSSISCLVLEGQLLDKNGLVDAIQGCTVSLDQKGPAMLSQLLPMVCAIENASSTPVVLHGVVMVPNATFMFTPLLPKRMCDVPLARILQQPLTLNVPGAAAGLAAQNGLLTMDQARSVMPLTPDDPQAYSVPLVGVWIKNAPSVQHPIVAACCFRFRYCTTFNDRALQAGGAFLVALFTESSTTPEYYECEIKEATGGLQLLPCSFSLTKKMPPMPGPGPDIVTPVPDIAMTSIKLQAPDPKPSPCAKYTTPSSNTTTAATAGTSFRLPAANSRLQFHSESCSAGSEVSSPYTSTPPIKDLPPSSHNAFKMPTPTSCASSYASSKLQPAGGAGILDGMTPHATTVHYDMCGAHVDATHVQAPSKPQKFLMEPQSQPQPQPQPKAQHQPQPQSQPQSQPQPQPQPPVHPAMRLEAPGGAAVSLVMPPGMPSWCVTAQVHTTLTTPAPHDPTSTDPKASLSSQHVQTTHSQQFTLTGGSCPADLMPAQSGQADAASAKEASNYQGTDHKLNVSPAMQDVVKVQGGIMESLRKSSDIDVHSWKDNKRAGMTPREESLETAEKMKDAGTGVGVAGSVDCAAIVEQQQVTSVVPRDGERPGLTPEAMVLQGQIQELRRQVQELQQQVAAVAAANLSNPPSLTASLEGPLPTLPSSLASFQQHSSQLWSNPSQFTSNLPPTPTSNMYSSPGGTRITDLTRSQTFNPTPGYTASSPLMGPSSRPSTPQNTPSTLALSSDPSELQNTSMQTPRYQSYPSPGAHHATSHTTLPINSYDSLASKHAPYGIQHGVQSYSHNLPPSTPSSLPLQQHLPQLPPLPHTPLPYSSHFNSQSQFNPSTPSPLSFSALPPQTPSSTGVNFSHSSFEPAAHSRTALATSCNTSMSMAPQSMSNTNTQVHHSIQQHQNPVMGSSTNHFGLPFLTPPPQTDISAANPATSMCPPSPYLASALARHNSQSSLYTSTSIQHTAESQAPSLPNHLLQTPHTHQQLHQSQPQPQPQQSFQTSALHSQLNSHQSLPHQFHPQHPTDATLSHSINHDPAAYQSQPSPLASQHLPHAAQPQHWSTQTTTPPSPWQTNSHPSAINHQQYTHRQASNNDSSSTHTAPTSSSSNPMTIYNNATLPVTDISSSWSASQDSTHLPSASSTPRQPHLHTYNSVPTVQLNQQHGNPPLQAVHSWQSGPSDSQPPSCNTSHIFSPNSSSAALPAQSTSPYLPQSSAQHNTTYTHTTTETSPAPTCNTTVTPAIQPSTGYDHSTQFSQPAGANYTTMQAHTTSHHSTQFTQPAGAANCTTMPPNTTSNQAHAAAQPPHGTAYPPQAPTATDPAAHQHGMDAGHYHHPPPTTSRQQPGTPQRSPAPEGPPAIHTLHSARAEASAKDSHLDLLRTSTSSSLSSIPPTVYAPSSHAPCSAIVRCKDLRASFVSTDSSCRYDCDDDGASLGSLSARGVETTHLGLSSITVHEVAHTSDPSSTLDIVRTKYIPLSDDSDSDSEEDARLMAKYGLQH